MKKLLDEAELMLSLVGSKMIRTSPLMESMLAVLIRMLTVKVDPTEIDWEGLASWSLNTWAETLFAWGINRKYPSEIKINMISLVFIGLFLN